MKSVFLDANIILDFYRFGKDDLSEIEKLVTLIEEKEIQIHTNSHLKDEVSRNREKILAETLQTLRSKKYDFQAPNICDDFDSLTDIQLTLKSVNKKIKTIADEIEVKIKNKSLRADELIKAIFDLGTGIIASSTVFERAQKRVSLGNPPGKRNSVGDSIHWDILLDSNIIQIDLVSRDGDFSSELYSNQLAEFLSDEWRNVKKSEYAKPTLFKSLSEYFKHRFPNIKLSEHAEASELISQLSSSDSFATTHTLIALLSKVDTFTNNQVVRLFEALAHNSQVRSIAMDSDVHDFYVGLKYKAYWVPTELEDTIAEALKVDKYDFFIPF